MFWYSLKNLPGLIEEGENHHTCSDVWPARPIYSDTELRLKYVYNYILDQYRPIRSELRSLTYSIKIQDQTLNAYLDPYPTNFFLLTHDYIQVKVFVAILLVLAIMALCLLRLLVRCLCCSKKTTEPVAK